MLLFSVIRNYADKLPINVIQIFKANDLNRLSIKLRDPSTSPLTVFILP